MLLSVVGNSVSQANRKRRSEVYTCVKHQYAHQLIRRPASWHICSVSRAIRRAIRRHTGNNPPASLNNVGSKTEARSGAGFSTNSGTVCGVQRRPPSVSAAFYVSVQFLSDRYESSAVSATATAGSIAGVLRSADLPVPALFWVCQKTMDPQVAAGRAAAEGERNSHHITGRRRRRDRRRLRTSHYSPERSVDQFRTGSHTGTNPNTKSDSNQPTAVAAAGNSAGRIARSAVDSDSIFRWPDRA